MPGRSLPTATQNKADARKVPGLPALRTTSALTISAAGQARMPMTLSTLLYAQAPAARPGEATLDASAAWTAARIAPGSWGGAHPQGGSLARTQYRWIVLEPLEPMPAGR